MLNEIYEDTEEHMQKSIEALKRDFSTLRTGKVSTNILDPYLELITMEILLL